ncbi:MAG: hypothetical protein F6K40_39340, partial [Okeania sp. SIO3I5]|nr:hypothetical protein [Okeania sp. SIO3I5]
MPGQYNLKALIYQGLGHLGSEKSANFLAFKTKNLGRVADTSQKDTGTIIPPTSHTSH